MTVFIIAAAAPAGFGALFYFAPQKVTRADMRDDPDAVVQVKKTGRLLMAAAVGAVLLALKYSLT